jgi:hypothetical protein
MLPTIDHLKPYIFPIIDHPSSKKASPFSCRLERGIPDLMIDHQASYYSVNKNFYRMGVKLPANLNPFLLTNPFNKSLILPCLFFTLEKHVK